MSNYEQGEELARQCLIANGFQIIDRRANPEYWAKDIDFTAIKGNRSADIEIKWDNRMHQSGAFFFELITDIEKQKPGWATYTGADYIFYGDAVGMVFYIFPVGAMRQYLKNHYGEYNTRRATDYNRTTGAVRKQSLGAVVPLAAFQQEVPVQVLNIQQRLGMFF